MDWFERFETGQRHLMIWENPHGKIRGVSGVSVYLPEETKLKISRALVIIHFRLGFPL